MSVDNNRLIMQRELAKINKDFIESLQNYQNYMKRCETDIPIEALCLPNDILKILRRNRLHRVCDIFDLDLTKIKGLGRIRISYINSRLQEFFPM